MYLCDLFSTYMINGTFFFQLNGLSFIACHFCYFVHAFIAPTCIHNVFSHVCLSVHGEWVPVQDPGPSTFSVQGSILILQNTNWLTLLFKIRIALHFPKCISKPQKICKFPILESLSAVNNFAMTFTRKSIADLKTDDTDKSISYLRNILVKGINSLQLCVPFSRVLLHIHNLMHRDSYKVASNALFSHIWNLTPV